MSQFIFSLKRIVDIREVNKMEIVKTRKTGLLIGFTVFISLYLVLINLFFSGFVTSFDEESNWIPQVILVMLLPYILSTINQIMKDRIFSIINNGFIISIAIYVCYFAFNIIAMATKNNITLTFEDVQMYLSLPTYGFVSMLVYMVSARIAVRHKVFFHLTFGVLMIVAILGFLNVVDPALLNKPI